MLMDFYPHCTETEVRADGDRDAYPIDTLATLAFPPGHDRKDTPAERRSLRDPRRVPPHTFGLWASWAGTLTDPHVKELLKRTPTTRDWRQGRDDSVSVPDAVDLESQITLLVLANCEGVESISEVDAAQVNA